MSSRYSVLLSLSLLTFSTAAQAVNPKAAAPEPVPVDTAPTPGPPPPPYELKNKSTFALSSTNPRPPFWPIGWVHHDASSPVVSAPAAVKATLDQKYFKVTSILLGSGTNPSLAIINGRPYSEGEFVRMPRTPGAPPTRVRILRIIDGSVTLQHAEQTFTVPLLREELLTKHGEEKLLDEQDRDDVDPAPVPAGRVTTGARPTTPNPPRTARP